MPKPKKPAKANVFNKKGAAALPKKKGGNVLAKKGAKKGGGGLAKKGGKKGGANLANKLGKKSGKAAPKKATKKKTKSSKELSHGTLNKRAEEIGKSAGGSLGAKKILIKLDKMPAEFRKDFVKRLIDKAKEDKEASPVIDAFERWYRAHWDEMDELVSTSTVRQFLQGLFEKQDYTTLSKTEIELINAIADQISAIRLPTKYSGYSLSTEVMQHPTSETAGIFANPRETAKAHAQRDVQRKKYVVDAMQKAIDAKGELADIAKAGIMAGIEFTLNYFTAPITASNVLPFSRKKNAKASSDPEIKEQLEARERMKARYVELGGKLEVLKAPETAEESRGRQWLGPPSNNVFTARELSPERQTADL